MKLTLNRLVQSVLEIVCTLGNTFFEEKDLILSMPKLWLGSDTSKYFMNFSGKIISNEFKLAGV